MRSLFIFMNTLGWMTRAAVIIYTLKAAKDEIAPPSTFFTAINQSGLPEIFLNHSFIMETELITDPRSISKPFK